MYIRWVVLVGKYSCDMTEFGGQAPALELDPLPPPPFSP